MANGRSRFPIGKSAIVVAIIIGGVTIAAAGMHNNAAVVLGLAILWIGVYASSFLDYPPITRNKARIRWSAIILGVISLIGLPPIVAKRETSPPKPEPAFESHFSLWEKVGTNCGFPNYSPVPLEGTEIHLKVGQGCTFTPTVMSAHPSHTLKGTYVTLHFPREMQYAPLQQDWINDGRDGALDFRAMIGLVPPTAHEHRLEGNSPMTSLSLSFNEAKRYPVTYEIRAFDSRGFKPIPGEFAFVVE